MRDYLLVERHVTAEQAMRWRFGFATEGRLAGRVVIITRREDRTIAHYAARAIGRTEKRYLFPSESEHADLGPLFGEEHWSTVARATVVVAEGAFNALAIERALGIDIAVAALSGSRVTAGTIARLGAFARVVVATDADQAGDRAARRIECGLAGGPEVIRVRLPEGEDADTIAVEDLRARLYAVCYSATRRCG